MKKSSRLISALLAVLMVMSVITVMPVAAKVKGKAAKFTLANTAKGVTVKWSKTSGAKKYIVLRKLSSAKKYTTVKTVKTSKAGSFTDTKVKAGKTYNYCVSANAAVTTKKASKSIVYLKAPTGVKVSVASTDNGDEVRVSWSKTTGAKKYEVYRGVLDKNNKYTLKKIKTVTGTKLTDTPKNGSSYVYAVKAVNGSSKSVISKNSSVVLTPADMVAYGKVSSDYKGISVYWEETENDVKYIVYRAEGDSSDFEKIAEIAPSKVQREMPVTIELSELATSMGSSKELETIQSAIAKGGFPVYTDYNVEQGKEYTYFVETAYSAGMARSATFAIKCQDADLVLEKGQVYKDIQNILTSPEYGEALNSITGEGLSLKINCASDNPEVATVDDDCTITAVAPGYANIKGEIILSAKVLIMEIPVVKITANFRVKVTE